MNEFKCEECQRNFSSEEGLQQHNKDKHGIVGAQSKHEMRQLKKEEKRSAEKAERKRTEQSKLIKRSMYIAVPVLVIISVSVFLTSQPEASSTANTGSAADIPKTPIHWHPKLEILIKGQEYPVPMNLGASGSVHFPVHTHTENDGTLHYEVNNPTPENMPLRYFFEKVWRKQFNSTCILDYCNSDSETVKMFVNGDENSEFENYIPKDRDQIRIEFN